MNGTACNTYLLNQLFWCVDFPPPDHGKKKIFIAVGAISLGLCLILIIVVIARWKGYLGGRTSREEGIIILLSDFIWYGFAKQNKKFKWKLSYFFFHIEVLEQSLLNQYEIKTVQFQVY